MKDSEIKRILQSEISIPLKCKSKVKGFEFKKKKREYIKILRPLEICIGIIMILSIGYASSNRLIEKVWNTPKEYNSIDEYIEDENTKELNKEQINEEEAKNTGIEFLNKLKIENIQIKSIELKKGYNSKIESYYHITFNNGINILIDALENKVFNLYNTEFNEQSMGDNIGENQAKDIANEVYETLNLSENYELISAKEEQYHLWNVEYNKKYGETCNRFQNISISFKVINNSIKYKSILIEDEKFDQNDVIISKEKAVEIAKEKENQLSKIDIGDVTAQLSIEKLNTTIYELENIEKYDENTNYILQPDLKIRNVWKVRINHINPKNENEYQSYNYYLKDNFDKEYYVDATTGEIIGGKIIY